MNNLSMPSSSPRQMLTQDFGLGKITINYSRPSIKGRTVFDTNSILAPFDKLWRFGADAATQISFTDDVKVEGNKIPAGSYLLLAIPQESKWQIIFNTDIQAGLRGYNQEKNILVLNVPVIKKVAFVETFTLQLHSFEDESCCLEVNWGNVSLSINIETQIVERLKLSFEDQMKTEQKPYFQASLFNFKLGQNLPKALEYITLAISQVPGAYYMYFVKANIEKKLGDKLSAKKTAEECFEAAVAAGSEDYQRLAKDFISKI
jgi:hypothetical protein